jgi:hypothetical protein
MKCVKIKYIETFPIKKNLISKINFQKNISFYLLKVHFTFKIPSFHMDLLTSHLFTYIYMVIY